MEFPLDTVVRPANLLEFDLWSQHEIISWPVGIQSLPFNIFIPMVVMKCAIFARLLAGEQLSCQVVSFWPALSSGIVVQTKDLSSILSAEEPCMCCISGEVSVAQTLSSENPWRSEYTYMYSAFELDNALLVDHTMSNPLNKVQLQQFCIQFLLHSFDNNKNSNNPRILGLTALTTGV